MFPYSTDNPLESSLFIKKQVYDENPISKLPHDPFFSNFPSPFFDEHDQLPLNHIIFPHSSPDPPISNCHVAAPPRRRNPPRKRITGKKDRHSKIRTAQGVRDRRMRLSLQVARKFFDLQDMLGYDKASKTIEWLFSKSKKAIKDLTKDVSLSECEVVEENSNTANPKEKGRNARESRERARARARCRTRQKMMIKELGERVCAYDDEGTIEKLLRNSSSAPPTNNNNFMGFLGNWDDRFQLAVTNQDQSLHPPGIYSPTTSKDFQFFLFQHD